jgi:hypothetical protein
MVKDNRDHEGLFTPTMTLEFLDPALRDLPTVPLAPRRSVIRAAAGDGLGGPMPDIAPRSF